MAEFLLCVLQYVLIMAVLAVVGGCGAFVGIRLRKNKDGKAAANNAVENKQQNGVTEITPEMK